MGHEHTPPQSPSLLHWLHSSGGRDIPLPALPSFVSWQWPRVMDMCECSDVIVPEFQICMTGLGRGSMRIRWALRHSIGFKKTIFRSHIPRLLVANATHCVQVVCVLRELRNMLPPRALPIDGWNLIHELSSAEGKPRVGSCVFIPYSDLRITTTGTGVCMGVLRGKYPAGLSRSAPRHTWVEYGTNRWCYEVPDDLVFAARCDTEMYLQNAVVEGWWMLPAEYMQRWYDTMSFICILVSNTRKGIIVQCDDFDGLTGRISNVYYNNSPKGGVLASSSDELIFHAGFPHE